MATVFGPPKKNLLPLLLLLVSLSVFALFVLFSETTRSDAEIGTDFRRNSGDVPPFTFLVKVLTFNRLLSLSRCLRSLAAADYSVAGDAGRVHLHVYIDHFSLARNDTSAEDNLKNAREILEFVDGFEWRFGKKVVQYRTDNVGLQAQWLEAWWPSSDHEFAFVVEDDLEVSPLYFRFLESVIRNYYYDASSFSPSIYGASLQRPRFVPGKHGNKLRLDPGTKVFLYQLVGTWGQLLFPKPWKEFRLWYDDHKAKGIKPILDGMVTTGWYKKMGERIWTPWFIKFIHSRGYFNIYTNFQNERALSVSHRDAGVNYGKTAGPDSELLDKSSFDSNFLKLQPLSSLKWYDFCFREVVPSRVVRNLDQLGTLLPSVQSEKTILLVSLYDAQEMLMRNLICHFEKLDTRNHIFIGPSSELLFDLARRGHPVIDSDQFLDNVGAYNLAKSQSSYPNAVKEALGTAHVVKKCLELGYSSWIFTSKALLVDKTALLDRVGSEYDFYAGEGSRILGVRHSSAAQKLWTDEFLRTIAAKTPSLKASENSIVLVSKLLEQKGKKIKNIDVNSEEGKPMVYWSLEADSNMIRKQLKELNLWLIDDADLSCKAVVCHRSSG
ncbi:PREDICTED: uncharacterized protein LOC104811206 [Tarenaya hassleriana]|uniref:uncharacterized protein LOC104811206 n=1 Tax=Tarenaya hassleriana TaxID=28532 RepID=UPI00053C7361|nr:PREDICTED: uncharacterized protein LOC104811206 [Tarenaya hassleriana]